MKTKCLIEYLNQIKEYIKKGEQEFSTYPIDEIIKILEEDEEDK